MAIRLSQIVEKLTTLSTEELKAVASQLKDPNDLLLIKDLISEREHRKKREKAASSLLDFTLYTKPNYIVGWANKIIAEELDLFLHPDCDYDRLIIQASPRLGKSELASRRFPAYAMGKNPDLQIIATSYADSLAQRNNRDVQRIIDDNAYREIFPNTRLNSSNVKTTARKNYIRTSDFFEIVGHTGAYRSAGVGAGITGTGADVLIIDDPLKDWKEATSKKAKDMVWEWYNSTAYTRLSPNGKVVIIMTRWACLLPDQELMTPNGLKRIDQFNDFDAVITSKGVQKAGLCRSKLVREEIFEIQTYGNPDPIKVTGDHRIMTTRGWVEAKDIKKSDVLISSFEKEPVLSEKELLNLFPKFEKKKSTNKSKNFCNNSKGRVDREELISLLNKKLTYSQIAKELGLGGKSQVHSYIKGMGLKGGTNNNTIDENCVLKESFWKICGLWVAEGSIGNSGNGKSYNIIQWALNKKEIYYVDLIKEALGLDVVVKLRRKTQAIALQVSSNQFAKFLSSNFEKGAINKRCPHFITRLPKHLKKAFLEGYFEGDGCYRKDGLVRGTSISKQLLYGLRSVLNSENVPVLIRQERVAKKSIIRGKLCNIKRTFSIAFWSQFYPLSGCPISDIDTQLQKVINEESQIRYKIRSIKSYHYEGLVYDIGTPCHDFLAEGVIVHNCDDLAGRLLKVAKDDPKADQWRVISLPMEYEPDAEHIHELDPRTEHGELVFPERFDRKFVDRRKFSLTPKIYAALYQQRPTVEGGNIFKRKDFRFYKALPTLEYMMLSVDATFTDTAKSDFVAFGVWGVAGKDKYLVYGKKERLNFTNSLRVIYSLIQRFPQINELIIEAKANGEAIISTMENDPMIKVPIFGYVPTESKESRAWAVTPQVEAGQVHLPDIVVERESGEEPWVESYISELTAFPSGAHDDYVDMTTQFLIRVAHTHMAWLQEEVTKDGGTQNEFNDIKRIFGMTGRGMGLGF